MTLQASGSVVRFGQSSEKFLSGIKQTTRAASIMTLEQPNKRLLRAIEQTTNDGSVVNFAQTREQLLPGILDDITEFSIIPKLQWKTRRTLSCVSPAWNRAIGTCAEARIRSLATDTKVIIESFCTYRPSDFRLISMADRFMYRLPPITDVGPGTGFRANCKFIFLNGKVYALGGLKQCDGDADVRVADVCVLDMVGQRQWQQCKSMQHVRAWEGWRAGAWAVRGKICVYGGIEDIEINVAELYDPESNTWDQIHVDNGRTLVDVVPEVQEATVADGELVSAFFSMQIDEIPDGEIVIWDDEYYYETAECFPFVEYYLY